jgi:hypothetical protein
MVIANESTPARIPLLKCGITDELVGASGLVVGALLPTAVAAAALMLA